MPTTEKFLNTREAAELLDISERKLGELRKLGLPGRKVTHGGGYRHSREAITKWYDEWIRGGHDDTK